MHTNELLPYEKSGLGRTAVNQVSLPPGGHLPLTGHPQERLYYFLDGRGIFSVYDPAPEGDVYEIRQDHSIYLTPGMKHEIINIGDSPLRWVEFLVTGGVAPDGTVIAGGQSTEVAKKLNHGGWVYLIDCPNGPPDLSN